MSRGGERTFNSMMERYQDEDDTILSESRSLHRRIPNILRHRLYLEKQTPKKTPKNCRF